MLTEVVHVEFHVPPPVLAAQMGLSKSERTLQILRLRGRAVLSAGSLTSELPERLGISPTGFSSRSTCCCENKYGIAISHGLESIRASKATVEEARLLGIEIETILVIERLTYRRGDTQPINSSAACTATASTPSP